MKKRILLTSRALHSAASDCCYISWFEKKIQFQPIAVNSVTPAISLLSCVWCRKGLRSSHLFVSKSRVGIEMHFLKANGLLNFVSRGDLRLHWGRRGKFDSRMMHGSRVYHLKFVPLAPRCTDPTVMHTSIATAAAAATITSASSTLVPVTVLLFVLPQGIPEFTSYTSASFSNFRDADLRSLVRNVVA